MGRRRSDKSRQGSVSGGVNREAAGRLPSPIRGTDWWRIPGRQDEHARGHTRQRPRRLQVLRSSDACLDRSWLRPSVLSRSPLKTRDGELPALLHLMRRRMDTLRVIGGRIAISCVIAPDCRTRDAREADQTAAVTKDQQAADWKVLQILADRPDLASSQDTIRRLASGWQSLEWRSPA